MLRSGAVAGDAQPRRVRTWLIARSLCRVRHFDLSTIAAKDRRAALRAMVLAWAPFETPQYQFALSGSQAWAWAWDASLVADLLRAVGADPQASLLPEDAARAAPATDGLFLQRGLDGFDAQRWQGGSLTATRWWPHAPTAAEWSAFERQAAVPDGEGMQPPANVPSATLLRSGWTRPTPLADLDGRWSRVEVIAAMAASTVLVAMTAGQGAQAWGLYQQLQARQATLAPLRDSAAATLAARDRAQDLATQARSLSQNFDQPQPLDVLNHLTQWLPSRGVVVKEFELTGRVLRLGLDLAPEVQRVQVVKNLITGGWISEITELRENTARAGVMFEMRLVGNDPKTPADAKRPEVR